MSLGALLTIVTMSICAAADAKNPSTSDYYDYMQATYLQRQGNIARAQQTYDHLLQKGNSLYPYQGYVKHLFATQQFSTIVTVMPSLNSFFKDDLDAQLIFAQALDATGSTREAENLFIDLGMRHPHHQEAAYYGAAALARRGNYAQALDRINTYLDSSTKKTVNFLFYFLQAQSYQQLKQYDKALESITACLGMAPEFYQGWLFFGIMNELVGNITAAISGYQNYLSIVGNDQAVYQQMLLLMLKEQNSSTTPHAKNALQYAATRFAQGQYQQALSSVDEYLKENPRDVQARLLKVDTLCALARTPEAVDLLKAWIVQNPGDDIWFKALHTLHEADKNPEHIISTLTQLAQQIKTSPLPHLYLADIHLRSATPDKARTHLQHALPLLKDPEIKTATLYQLALILYEKREFTHLKKVLEEARILGMRYGPLLNLYAYYEATKGNDLIFAQKLYDSILDQDKQNAHIAHTQAVIWYKQRDHEQAHQLLEQLRTRMPDDYYVQKYYAKNLYRLGKQRDAISTLAKALPLAPDEYDKQKSKQLIFSWQKK